jgi:hypothetical protein
MSTNIPFQTPFLRVQRLFPQEAQPLSVEIDRAYTDIASAVNSRVLSLFTTNNPIQNGERWYLNGLRYQGFRQFYTFTSSGSFPHGINVSNIFAFTRIYGTGFDGTNWFPLPYVDPNAANSQISLSVSPTNIIIVAGAGASPTITRAFIVLEWLSNA